MTILEFDNFNRITWKRCDHLVHSWLINLVFDSISQTVIFHENSNGYWNDLKERFSKTDCVCITTLRFELNKLKQESKSNLEYFIEMKTLWDEINVYRHISSCTCPHPCICEAIRFVRNYILKDQVIQFIKCLNEKIYVVKT